MKRITTLVCLLVVLFTQKVFAQINLISPVEGTWANRQLLLIDNKKDGDYFYSINGSDPEKFGFAYDGPVLLDTNGEITLRVTYVARNGHKESTSVNYAVIENDASSTNYEAFVYSFYDSGVLNYSSGSVITIPGNLYYSLGLPPDSYLPGQDIYLSEKSVLNRSIPCVIYDKATNVKWRFVINTFPQTAGIYSRRDVPFTITDWDKITFTDDNLLYKIDSEYWELPKKPRILDRSVSHMISWQSIDYNVGNPIEFFVLPPKPEISSIKENNGGITYTIDGDESYTMSVLSFEENEYQELFTELGVDTFYGDRVSGELTIGVFSNSVYQGELYTTYRIDKRPPAIPQITTNSQHFYCRENIVGKIIGEKSAELYVAVSEPLILEESGVAYDENNTLFKNVSADSFELVNSDVYDFNLSANGEGAVYYKVCAYSKSEENTSQVSEYHVIIDQYNYYYDSTADNVQGDGTIQNPFTNFNDCIAAVNKSRSVCLKVKGQMIIPSGKHEILANCVVQNNGNASILFEGDSSIVVKNSGLDISKIRILGKKGKSTSIIPVIKLENSVFTLNDCEVGFEFSKNGTFIDSSKSVINIGNSIISLSASSYSSFVSSVKSRINVKNSTVSTNADTSVIISSSDSDLLLTDNSLKVTGKVGRISELFNSNAVFEKNTFNAQLSKKGSVAAIYFDNSSDVIQKNNTNYGF